MLVRLIILVALAWLLWKLWRDWQRGVAERRRRADPPPVTVMSPCKHCGTYLPAETLSASGRCGRCNG